MYDVLFKNVLVVDGTGSPPERMDVGVKGERIAGVGNLESDSAEKTIDGTGADLVLTPGFIDTHSHADLTLPWFPLGQNMVYQGVTTFVGGNCGFSLAPLADYWQLQFWHYDAWADVVHFKYKEPTAVSVDVVRKGFSDRYGIDLNWNRFSEFLDLVRKTGSSVNYVPLVGHNTIRLAVMGTELRQPTDAELAAMRDHVREAMDAGAHGFSSGLDYYPGSVSEAAEVNALAEIVSEYEGIYTTHWRGSGITKGAATEPSGRPRMRIQGIREAIAIGESSGVRVLLSHIHGGFSVAPEPPADLAAKVAEVTMREIDEAYDRGLDVVFDVIPSTVGGVLAMPYLASYLAPWLREAGSLDRFAAFLKAEDRRDEIREAINVGKWWNLNPNINSDWALTLHVRTPQGDRPVADIAHQRCNDALSTVFDLIMEQADIEAFGHGSVSQVGVEEYLRHPRATIATDACSFDDQWRCDQLPGFYPHANNFGAVASFITDYRAEQLSAAVEQLTSRPAKWFGLTDRGVIQEGAIADIVVFDRGKYGHSMKPGEVVYARGVEYVLINGRSVLWSGKHTEDRPGQILLRDSC